MLGRVARAVGCALLAPPLAEVGFSRRGFPGHDSPAARGLEAIPQSVVCGFEWGMEAHDLHEARQRVETVDAALRGFAYEGTAMAFTVRDALPTGGSGWTRALMDGPARPHTLLAYIGIGFAMARLPRRLWKGVLPDLTDNPHHPTMSWLAVDGYGFDRAYFDTARWVHRAQTPRPYPWLGAPHYFHRAFDQGVGRALWFIHGARPEAVGDAVLDFAEERRPDLWSGVGLAAAFAGGADPEGLGRLLGAAGGLAPHAAQGAVFAAKARVLAGTVPGHTEVAMRALTGMDCARAAALADEHEVEPGDHGGVPAYEVWRAGVRAHFS
ncbi:DUF1702 family protein [Nocardiopsis sp. NRRL B-16309]|uniref:DUF1702 family protein n=1 Tax=Nocardiopsis sp. NRRL B-16309 TaxID=1519494 RepID=UPI0006AEB707|nr:DUF1702 family protein [Nocardiopsis sp. NRRL B-16309]